MTNLNPVREALTASHGDLAAEYQSRIRRAWDHLVQALEDQSMLPTRRNFHRAGGNVYTANLYQMTAPFMKSDGYGGMDDPITLNEERLEREANLWANRMIEDCMTKLEGKIGDLEDVSASRVHPDGSFNIRGTKQGHTVIVKQQRIFKVSPKGLPFYQWPARIYIDETFVTEKAYKLAFQDEEAVKAALR